MGTTLFPPNWAFRTLFRESGGGYLPKRKRIESAHFVTNSSQQGVRKTWICSKDGTFTPKRSKGNLPNNEYRFWVGSSFENSSWSQCRGCLASISSGETRKLHLSTNGCARKIVEAMKILHVIPFCICCGKATSQEKWGVFLCSADCQETWKFGFFGVKAADLRRAFSKVEVLERNNAKKI